MGKQGFLVSPYDLPKSKYKEYNDLKEKVVASGVQYALHYEKYEPWRCTLDTQEKKDAVTFILGELLEIAPLNYESSVIVLTLGDIETKKELTVREFKLAQEVIKRATFTGRKNHEKLAIAMKALNEAGTSLLEIEQQERMYATDYQACGNKYNQFCEKNGVAIENIDKFVEDALLKVKESEQKVKPAAAAGN